MRLGFLSLRFGLFSTAFIIFLFFLVSPVMAQYPILIVQPSDTVMHTYLTQNNVLSIYMTNWEDSVAAFTIVLTTSHPDVIHFQVGPYDVNGTLIENWEFVNTSGSSMSLKISGIANTLDPPMTPGIGYPQYGEVPLVKVYYDIMAMPDTMTTQTVEVYIDDDLHSFNFSDEQGNSIGLSYDDPTYDTLWYNCIEWVEDTCTGWEEAGGPPADTMIIDTVLHPYLDTNLVRLFDGTINIKDCLAMGDASGEGDVNIFDITFIITYLYLNGPDFPPMAHPDANCDCAINIYDVTCLISYLYQVGTPCEPCTCEQWELGCGK